MEQFEKKIWQSEDEEESVDLKETLLRRIIVEQTNIKNGRLMQLLVEFPKVMQEILDEKSDDEKYLIFHGTE